MANPNAGVTLAQIRNGTKELSLDTVTSSDTILIIQKALRVMGYWGTSTNPDKIFGSYSVAATRGYQNQNGLSVTGKMNKQTLTSIENFTGQLYIGHNATPQNLNYISKGLDVAQVNDKGNAITQITTYLKNLGFLTATTDTFTTTVRDAVYKFQGKYGLDQDYKVGQATLAALISPNTTNWFTSAGKVALTAGMLARCGFSCTLLLPTFVTKLNSAMNSYGVNTKEKARHFLAQVQAETANGYGIIESGYKAGDGVYNGNVLYSYSPYGGAGFLHLTHDYNYEPFSKAMNDTKIFSPAKYATQYVAIRYPGDSAGWFWKTNVDSNVDWGSGNVDTIGKKITDIVSNDSSKWANDRKARYQAIARILL